jgi:excisionase family DNA binding protein
MKNRNTLPRIKTFKGFYTVTECAANMGVSTPTINRAISSGALKAVKIYDRTLIPCGNLVEFARSREK